MKKSNRFQVERLEQVNQPILPLVFAGAALLVGSFSAGYMVGKDASR